MNKTRIVIVVPQALKREAKIQAAFEGKTLTQYIVDLLTQYAKETK